jgi:Domain of unknown function (DUF4412)
MNRVLAVLIAPIVLSCVALAQGVQAFSADTITKIAGRPEPSSGKIYLSPPKMRMDSSYRGHSSETIVDSEKGIAYRVMPEQHMYMKMDVKGALANSGFRITDYREFDPKHPCNDMAGAKCQRLGNESVNGRAADKWSVTDSRGKSMTIWLDKTIHYPIKSLLPDGTTTELTNIHEGPPPTSLFQVPSGFREFSLGGGGTSPHLR